MNQHLEKIRKIFISKENYEKYLSFVDFRQANPEIWTINEKTKDIELKNYRLSKEALTKVQVWYAQDILAMMILDLYKKTEIEIYQKIDAPTNRIYIKKYILENLVALSTISEKILKIYKQYEPFLESNIEPLKILLSDDFSPLHKKNMSINEHPKTFNDRYKNKERLKDEYNAIPSKIPMVTLLEGLDKFDYKTIYQTFFYKIFEAHNSLTDKLDEQSKKYSSKHSKNGSPEVKFNCVGVNIDKFLNYLITEKQYFNETDLTNLKLLFKGDNIETQINCLVKINWFTTIIYNLKKKKKIINTKEFLYSWIPNNFLFVGKPTKPGYIENIFKPKSALRIYNFDKKNYIDVKVFFIDKPSR